LLVESDDSIDSSGTYTFQEESHPEQKRSSQVSNSESEFEVDMKSQEAHQEHHNSSGRYIKSIIYGGLDGIVSVFVAVAAVAGANIGVTVILALGAAKLLAGAISMGVGDWLSTDASVDVAKRERKREEWEVDNFMEGEIDEMVELYKKKGVPEENAKKIMAIFAKNKKVFVDIMMAEELGITKDSETDVPWKHGLINFGSFMAFGIVPLIAYIVFVAAGIHDFFVFYISIGVTLFTLLGMGLIKGRMTGSSYWKSALITAVFGGFTAFIGWLVGFLLILAFPGVNIG